MATYKIIQDIEAEDKLVGPFALRQFIYLLIVAALLYITYRVGQLVWWMTVPFFPPIIFFALLALPLGGGQPTEVWLLAKIRFNIKPRKHVWEQSGASDLVEITAPKTVEKHLTKDYSQTEVQSRLATLASTLDTHGWSTKNIQTNPFANNAAPQTSDRLVLPKTNNTSQTEEQAGDDMFDHENNPRAQRLGELVQASGQARRKQAVAKMRQEPLPRPSNTSPQKDHYDEDDEPENENAQDKGAVVGGRGFDSKPDQPAQKPSQAGNASAGAKPPKFKPPKKPPTGEVVTPDPRAVIKQQKGNPKQTGGSHQMTEEELLEKIRSDKKKPKNYGRMRVVFPIGEEPPEELANQQKSQKRKNKKQPNARPPKSEPPQAPVTRQPDPGIIELANNDDLNVETIARQAKKNQTKVKSDKGEVVISLHEDE